MKQNNSDIKITFRRSYEITPLQLGHPFYSATGTRYEIVIKEKDNYALIYQDISPNEDVMWLMQQLEELSWKTLDFLNGFWDMYYNDMCFKCLKNTSAYYQTMQAMINAQYTFTNV